MYLLLSVSTRMIQAPSTTGGLDKSVVVAGLLMLPQALGSLAAGWITRRLGRWLPARWTLPLAGVVMMSAMALFALWRHSLPGLVAAMLLAGIGIGIIFCTAPALIVENTGSDQRGSALGFDQVFRYVGYGFGSVLPARARRRALPARHRDNRPSLHRDRVPHPYLAVGKQHVIGTGRTLAPAARKLSAPRSTRRAERSVPLRRSSRGARDRRSVTRLAASGGSELQDEASADAAGLHQTVGLGGLFGREGASHA
ncbi:MFS transporter [Streptomyces sp. PA03-1a]|nr:MFS transporter [Streptomyces sp. PA03-1a]